MKTILCCLTAALALAASAFSQNAFYFQDFTGGTGGQTNFTDGSIFLTTRTGTTNIGVVGANKELQFTDTTGIVSAFILPLLDQNVPVTAFSAKWNAVIAGNFPNAADGFSFNFGPFVTTGTNLIANNSSSAQESGYTNGISLSVQTYQNNNPGFYIRCHGSTLASAPYNPGVQWGTNNFHRYFFEVDWNIINGMTVRVDHQTIFANVPTPCYAPQIGDRFVWAARTGGLGEYVRMDNFTVVTRGNFRTLTVGSPYYQDARASGSGFGAFLGPSTYFWTLTNAGYAGGTLSSPTTVRAYSFSTDNQTNFLHQPDRPAQWTLQVSADSGASWGGANPTVSMKLTNYSDSWVGLATDPNPYSTWRFNVLTNGGSANLFFCAVELYDVTPAPATALAVADQGNFNYFAPSGHIQQQPTFYFNVYPSGQSASVTFDWGDDTSYGHSFTTNVAAGWSPVALQAPLGYMQADKDYHYRFTLQSAAGIVQTADQTFRVPAFVPININSFYSTVHLNFSVDSCVVAADIDKDGKMDLLLCGQGVSDTNSFTQSDVLFQLMNNVGGDPSRSDFRLVGYTTDLTANSWGNLWVDDFNNDDRLDFFSTGAKVSQRAYAGDPSELLWLGANGTNFSLFGHDPVAPEPNASVNPASINLPFDGGAGACVSVADFNGDGRKDVLLANGGNTLVDPPVVEPYGTAQPLPTLFFQSQWHPITNFSHMTGLGYFNFTPAATLPRPEQPHLTLQRTVEADYDGDGNIDIVLCPGGLFHNDGFGNLTHVTNAFLGASTVNGDNPESWIANAVWGDFDNDGKLDVILSFFKDQSVLFRNLGNGTFTNTGIVFNTTYNDPDVAEYDPIFAVADMDHDGRLDVYERWYYSPNFGFPSNAVNSVIFYNQGGSFKADTLPTAALALRDSSWGLLSQGFREEVALADLNNDGRLDIAEAGGNFYSNPASTPTTWITLNLRGTSNQPPTAPTGLSSFTTPGSVTLNWGYGTDDVTPSNSLTYNVRIGTSTGADDIMSALALPNGTRLVPQPGNKWLAHSSTFRLPAGTYYWSVQAVDGGFAGGPFALEQTFTITGDSAPHFCDILENSDTNSLTPTLGISMWTGYEAATCTLEYGLTTNYDHAITQTFTTNQSFQYFPGTTNYYDPTNIVSIHRFSTNVNLTTLWTNYHWRITVSTSAGTATMTDGVAIYPPRLSLITTAPNQMTLQWPDPGYVLEYKNTLNDPAWQTYGTPPTITNGQNTVLLPNNISTRFFRLRGQ